MQASVPQTVSAQCGCVGERMMKSEGEDDGGGRPGQEYNNEESRKAGA